MFFIGNQGYVLMPPIDSGSYYYAIANQATYQPGPVTPAFINQPIGYSMTSLSPSIHSQYISSQSNSSSASVLTTNFSQNQSTIIQTIEKNSSRALSIQNRPFTSRTSTFDTLQNSLNNSFRRTKSGYISKNRGIKRPVEINLHKSCPGCLKLWRKCQCSNIKNRPDPKPYSKFIPPRMLRKQNASN